MAARSSQDLACWRRATVEGLLEAGFRLGHIRDGLAQQQLALEPIHLREQVTRPLVSKHRQRLGQQAQPLLDLAGVPRQPQRAGPDREAVPPRLPRGQDGGHALAHLCQACLALALHGQRPAAPARPIPHPERKPLRGRQGQEGLGLRLDRRARPGGGNAGRSPRYWANARL